jgi:hypothetical protein
VTCSTLQKTTTMRNLLILQFSFLDSQTVSIFFLYWVDANFLLCSTLVNHKLSVLLKGAHNNKLVLTATHIIASMKRDWMQVCVTPPVTYMLFVLRVLFILLWLCVNVALQTGRKPSGICGAALYTAALSHGIKCSKTDIVRCSIQLVF